MVRDKQFYKTLLTIAVPVALQSLINMSVSLLDNAMVGSLGETVISAVALSNYITVFFTYLVNGVSGGASVLISQYWGKGDRTRIKQVFALVFYIAVGLAVVAFCFARFFPRTAVGIFTNEQAIIDAAVPYITMVCFSYILFGISQTMVGMMRCVEVVKVSLYVSIVSFCTNLFFNYALIFGKFGFPQWGAYGAAVATVIARAAELAMVAVYMFLIQKKFPIKPKELFKTDRLMIKDYVKFGVPVLIGDSQWGFVGFMKNVIIGRSGPMLVAANSIAEVVMNLAAVFTMALGSASGVMIGKTVGAKEYEKTRQYSNTFQILFATFGFVMCVLLFLFRDFPLQFYNIEPETRALASKIIAIGAITLVGTYYHATCFTGICRGAGDGRFVFVVDLICGWAVVLPLMYLSAFVWKLPLEYIFLASRIDQCFKWLIAFIRLRGNRWIRNVTRD